MAEPFYELGWATSHLKRLIFFFFITIIDIFCEILNNLRRFSFRQIQIPTKWCNDQPKKIQIENHRSILRDFK